MNVSTLTTKELLAVYNKFAPSVVTRFADRKTAERRAAPYVAKALAEEAAKFAEPSVYGFSEHGLVFCPVCDTHLSNGISRHGDDVNGKPLRHTSGYLFECLSCGNGFGSKVRTGKGGSATGKRPEMSRSMSLHREVESVTTGKVYKNAFAIYKAGVITASECNRMRLALLNAAKAGNRKLEVEVRGNVYRLHLS